MWNVSVIEVCLLGLVRVKRFSNKKTKPKKARQCASLRLDHKPSSMKTHIRRLLAGGQASEQQTLACPCSRP
jgi:hypothetical protein